MTLKNHKNHFNIKLLSGYGISIKQKDNQIILNHKPDPFSKTEQEEWFVTNLPYEKLVVSGHGYITFDALKSLAENNRNTILTDTSGKPICFMNGLMDSPHKLEIHLQLEHKWKSKGDAPRGLDAWT